MCEIFIFIALVIFCFWSVYTVVFLAPWLPTFTRDLERIAQKTDLKPGNTFCEIGSGDGRVSLYMAKRFPKSRIIGVEISFVLFIFSVVRKRFQKNKNIQFIRCDFYGFNISAIDVMYVFATPHSSSKLSKHLYKNMKNGSRVISYNFELPFDKSVKRWIDKVDDDGMNLYIYDIVN